MAFIFSTSHLPETRSRRPDHLEEEEDDDGTMQQPPPRAGMVRAFSHLPAKRVAADPAGPLSQRSAQAFGRQFQRTEELGDTSTPHADGIAAAKASGVFDVVRQQLNRDDSPHFMDEDGNLRPRDESRQQGSPAPRAPRNPQFGAGSPPRPAWSAGHAAGADASSSRSPRAPSSASADTRPWYMPPVTPEDLDSQHSDDDAAVTGFHSGPQGRPEVQDLVYRTPGASTPKTGLQDLLYRDNNSPEEARDHRRDYIQNVAAPADARGHPGQQTKTYGAAPDSRGNGSSYAYADNAGSGSQPSATDNSTRRMSIPEFVAQGKIAQEEATKKWNQLKNPEAAAAPTAEAKPTIEMLEQNEKHLKQQMAGAEMVLKKHYEGAVKLRNIREKVQAAGVAQDLAKDLAPLRLALAVFFGNAAFGWAPEEIIGHIDAEPSKRDKQSIQHQEAIADAKGKWMQAITMTEVAKGEEKKRELEEKRRQQLEEKKRQQDEDKKKWESAEKAKNLQELKKKHEQEKREQELKRQKQQQPLG